MEWRKIDGFPGYEVSDTGDIKGVNRIIDLANGGKRSLKERLLKTRISRAGYVEIKLLRDKKQVNLIVHRLVAKAFIPNPEGLPQTNHKNGCKICNNVENLEWSDARANGLHAYQTGLNKNCGCNHKKAVKVIDIATNLIYCTITLLCELYNVPYSAFIKALNGDGHLPEKYGLDGHSFERC